LQKRGNASKSIKGNRSRPRQIGQSVRRAMNLLNYLTKKLSGLPFNGEVK
jgi:hypothetical protein